MGVRTSNKAQLVVDSHPVMWKRWRGESLKKQRDLCNKANIWRKMQIGNLLNDHQNMELSKWQKQK